MSELKNKKEYLEVLDEKILSCIADIEKLSVDDGYTRLQGLLKNIIQVENELRNSHQLGQKLSVVRQQLQKILMQFEKQTGILKSKQTDINAVLRQPGPHEIVVYVLLFNAQGGLLKTWERAFAQDALSDYSVNRPIYLNKDEILKVIAAKTMPAQHASLAVIVNKKDAESPMEGDGVRKDQQGFALLKLKEGALKRENIQEFYHNGAAYHLKEGVLTILNVS